ncbi:MAG: hypothetical protein QOE58_2245, partial [Actinomycetota bacterium]|nr:hypothetical protein [Actinomycetota bacterium]
MPRTKGFIGSIAVLIVLVGLYGALATSLAGRMPAKVTVDGIKVGDLSAQQATLTLRRALADRVLRPVHLRVQARSVDIAPGPAGLDADVEATVADLTGFTVNPVRLLSRLTGTREMSFTLRVDHRKLIAAVSKAVRSLDQPVREGSVEFSHGKATAVPSVPGTKVNVGETADALVSAWPRRQVVQAVTKVTRPTVSAAEIRRATREFTASVMSAPVTLRTGPDLAAITLAPRRYAPALSTFADSAGRLHLRIDTPKLMAAIRAAAPGLETNPTDATLELIAGKARVVPGAAGTTFDGKAMSAKFRAALTSSSRSVTTRLVPVQPAVTTAIAQGWGIKGAISTFTTQFPVNPPRTNNIKLAVAALNDTVVLAGDQFSLNAAVGQRTSAKGYLRAPVIN